MTVVLVGQFTPENFFPKALAKVDAISAQEASAASPRVVLPNMAAQFDLLWGELTVTKDRFQVGAKEAPYVRISDLAIKALRELEPEAGLSAFGVNVESHFDIGSTRARDELGCRLAPPKAWGPWGAQIEEQMTNPELHGGVVNIQMRQVFIDREVGGWLDLTVGPSDSVPENRGVFFRTNHHHQFRANSERKREPLELLDVLAERFDASVLAAENIFSSVLQFTPQ